jgi:hypothetical protein
MARARIVVGTTAVGGAADGPVQHHGARSYSGRVGNVKTGPLVGFRQAGLGRALKDD